MNTVERLNLNFADSSLVKFRGSGPVWVRARGCLKFHGMIFAEDVSTKTAKMKSNEI